MHLIAPPTDVPAAVTHGGDPPKTDSSSRSSFMLPGMNPTEAAEAALAADHAHDDPAIWITRLPDADILARARVLEAEGPHGRPLWGVPFAVKDSIDVAGLPTTAACPGYHREVTATAPAVQRLLDAGAVLIGKTNLDQFATGLVGTRSPYGTRAMRTTRRWCPGIVVRLGRGGRRRESCRSRSAPTPPGPGGCRRRSKTSSG